MTEERHQEFLKQKKVNASKWARGVLDDPAAVILDTETTGLEGRIVEISAIHVLTGTVLLDTLVNPERPIPAGAAALHGITDEMVKDAPTFAEIYPEIQWVVNNARVVIYNAAFDEGRLRADTYRCDLPKLEFKSECAMEQYACWYGEWSDYHKSFKWQKLTGGHRALEDCRATLERIKIMAEYHEVKENK